MTIHKKYIELEYKPVDKYEFIPWSNQRLAAAKRALKKERERAGLFGEELMRFTTINERISIMEDGKKDFIRRMRGSDARELQEIREKFSKLSDETQDELIAYWNSKGKNYPRKPSFFLGIMLNLERDPLHIKRETGKAHPYTRTVVYGYGDIRIEEITKEQYEASFMVK